MFLAILLLVGCSAEAQPATPPMVPATPVVVAETPRGIPSESLPAPLEAVPDCPVTQPTGGPQPGETRWSPSIYEQNGQMAGLWPNGTVFFEVNGPGSAEPNGSLGMKF